MVKERAHERLERSMTGTDFQNLNESRTAEADAALVTTFAVGAHDVDTVEPDGGELAAAMAYLAAVVGTNI